METTLLLADPHTIVREGLRALISSREDLVVIGEAGDGEQALELAERLRPDIVILETHLPKVSGLEVFSKSPADAVTAITLPDGVDGTALAKRMRDHYGVAVAGGQDHLKGRIVRIAHMGYVGTFDLVIAIAALEMALADAGARIELGAGVAAVEEALRGD